MTGVQTCALPIYDAMRAIHLYCDLVAGSVLDGLQAELAASGVDIGARSDLAEQAFAAEVLEESPEEAAVDGLQGASQDESSGGAAVAAAN